MPGAISSARSAPTDPAPSPGLPASVGSVAREAYLDRLKAWLVAVIIAGHAALAYGTLANAWPYQDVHEVQLSRGSDVALDVVVIPAAMFAMGLFFLIAGMVAPASLLRRGAKPYARSRLQRLGLPLVVWTLLLWPLAIGLAQAAAGHWHGPRWQLRHHQPVLDTGPMWFALVLLIYSLVYAGWWTRRRRQGRRAPRAPQIQRRVSPARLVWLAVAIAACNLVLRPLIPAGGDEPLQIHLWQWPQCIALFCLGIAASADGWVTHIDAGCRHRAGTLAIGGIIAFAFVALAVAATGTDGDLIFRRGLHWPALGLAVVEGPLAVGASVWLVAAAQRHLARPPGRFGRAVARSAYGAFVVQGLVLMALMIMLRGITAPAEVKAAVAAVAGVTGSFALAWALASRTPLRAVL